MTTPQGILLINKPAGKSSFSLIPQLRKRLGVKKIGHAGTLDPFATGVLVMLIGRDYTRLSDRFLNHDKAYRTQVHLGIATDTYDCDGAIIAQSDEIPTLEEIKEVLSHFQGHIEQIPPMYSAKKIGGKKLYDLARQGKEIERAPAKVHLEIELLEYSYPHIELNINCSKGTYIRSFAFDLGTRLGCGAHVSKLQRTRSGPFLLEKCVEGHELQNPNFNLHGALFRDVATSS